MMDSLSNLIHNQEIRHQEGDYVHYFFDVKNPIQRTLLIKSY